MSSIRKYYETFTLSLIMKLVQQTQADNLCFLNNFRFNTVCREKKVNFCVSMANTLHMVCTDVCMCN
jgi:hypothetical protein